jgi:hypothetical protein
MFPIIKKSAHVFGSNLYLRDIEEDDASFILNLRINPVKSKYLSGTSGKLEDQISWIKGYKTKQDQAYFIVCNNQGNRLGCIRMYDPIESSYRWGSWLMISGLSPLVSIESVLLIYAYGKYLGFEDARFDVRQDNKFVWNFHEKFSFAELTSQTELDRFYVVRRTTIDMLLKKYPSLVPLPLRIN